MTKFYVLLNAGMDTNGNSRKWYVGYNEFGLPCEMVQHNYRESTENPALARLAPEIRVPNKELREIKKQLVG